jgi:hypothetical protein
VSEKQGACQACGVGGTESHTFDSFECAIQALAPTCDHCGLRIVGHGVEKSERNCCARCASAEGVRDLRARA